MILSEVAGMEDSDIIPGNGTEHAGAPCSASPAESGILAELAGMRESLRDGKEDGIRGRSVCSDEVLEEMAGRLPVRTEDLAAIPGVGQRFIEQYGEAFLEITGRYAAAAAGGIGIRCETAAALKELEKNLTDLGCHLFQGYYFSKPIPVAAFEEMVKDAK